MLEMIILQIDVIGTYLKSTLSQNNHPIYIKISQKCEIRQEKLVNKILRSLYDLKQARKL